ncbi:TonB-dependent receptor plug domain-containing protein [Megasphaera sp. UBA4233]|uniref:TonB-dependent receptor plug domain-containing protein n=1 Tax=Megasphaera sp. UBA4233 TaxID=1946847 RepID=UPI0025C4217E|nr:TonB-dependent receptor [Megasphaera sp. UBA4233]
MTWEKKKGRVAAGLSVSLHAAVYLALAAGGFFTIAYNYTRQEPGTVTVYNANDLSGAGGRDAAGTDGNSGSPLASERQEGGRIRTDAAQAPSMAATVTNTYHTGPVHTAATAGEPSRSGRAETAGPGMAHGDGGSGRAAGPGTDESAAPSGSIHVAGALADMLDALRDRLPDIGKRADKERPVPSVPARQSNTTIITREDIQTHRDQTVQEALQRVTGVTVNEQVPGISSFVKLNGDDRVLILVDGQSLANAQGSGYGRGSVDLTSLPGVAAIDHIEVTKGSGSVRYGSGAVGGVINIVTKKADHDESTLSAYTGSWGMHGYTLTNSGKRDRTSWLVSGSMERRQYYAFPHGINTDRSRGDIFRQSFDLRLDQELTRDSSLTFKAYHQDYHGHGSTFLPSYSRSLPRDLRKERLPGWYLSTNKVIERLINDYSLTYNFHTRSSQPGFLRYFNDYQRTFWTNHFLTRTQGLEWQNNWQLGPHQHVTAGAEWTEDMGTNYEAHYIDKKRHNRAVYAEDALNFGKWTVTPGLRIDDNSTFGLHRTPRLAMNYKANDAFNVYASWGRVFSPPRLNDQFYVTSSSRGREDLQPEEGYTQTLGFQYQIHPKSYLEGSIFHSHLRHVIRWNRSVTPHEAENLDEEDKRGMELTWKQKVNDHWEWNAGYSYIHTRTDSGDGLVFDETYNQPNGYRAGVAYHSKKWQASVDMTAGTGRNDTYYSNNSYVVWNGSVSYAASKDMTIYGKINNINDESYDLYHNYPASGRNWQIGIQKKF